MIIRSRPPLSSQIPNPPFSLPHARKEEKELTSATEAPVPPASTELKETNAKKTNVRKTVRKVRARDVDGEFIGDDPSTPDVDEAWVEEEVE